MKLNGFVMRHRHSTHKTRGRETEERREGVSEENFPKAKYGPVSIQSVYELRKVQHPISRN